MRRRETTEEAFARIGQDTLTLCDGVPCDPAEYRAGLRGIIEDLRVAIQASLETSDDEE